MLVRKLIELLFIFGVPLLLCAGGIYGVFFISATSDIPQQDSLTQTQGQISRVNYEQNGDSPNIQFYIVGTPDPFLIRNDMGHLPRIVVQLQRAKAKSQAIAVGYTTTRHNLMQREMVTLNHPWQIHIVAIKTMGARARSADDTILSYTDMVQVQKDDNQDMNWLGLWTLFFGVTSLASVTLKLRRERLASHI